MAKLEITNMVLVRDRTTGKVVVIDRVISWKGIAFSGGHAEDGESIYDSAVREIREETGLTVQNLKPVVWFTGFIIKRGTDILCIATEPTIFRESCLPKPGRAGCSGLIRRHF